MTGYERCGVCAGLARVAMLEGVPVGFERHRYPSSRDWCPNGTQPVARPKKKRRRGSIWSRSSGLPTLGRDR